jgi:hypothetical protein
MSAAYYDVNAEQGSTFRMKLTVADKNGKALNLKGNQDGYVPIGELPEGFEDRFLVTDSQGITSSIAKVFLRMQVRDSVDGSVVPISQPPEIANQTNSDELTLFGVSGFGSNVFPIDIELGDGGTTQEEPNAIITIEAIYMENIPYGKPLYDIEVVYAQDTISHPNKVVYRLVQGRFIISPNITRFGN